MINNKFTAMYDRLPNTVKASEALSLKSKKVLAALLELLLHSDAKDSGIIIVANTELRKLSGVRNADLLQAIYELEDYDLITRQKGYTYEGTREASHYVINFEAIQKPIEVRTFADLFQNYIKSQEMPMGTRVPEDLALNGRNEAETPIFDTPKSLETPMGTANKNINKNTNKNINENRNKKENRNIHKKGNSNTNVNENKSIKEKEKKSISNNSIYLKKEKEKSISDMSDRLKEIEKELLEFEAAVTENRSTETMTVTPTEVEVLDETSVGVPLCGGDTSEGKGDTATPTEAESTPIGDDAFPAPTTAQNPSDGETIHQDGEKPLQGQEMPSNGITVQYPCGEVTFRNKEEQKFFDQVGVLLKRLEDEDDDTRFTVKLGKFRKWLLERGIRKETFDGEILRQVVANREEAKKFRRIERQRRLIGYNDRPMW